MRHNLKKQLVVVWEVLIILAFLVLPAGADEGKAKDFVKEAAQGGAFEVEAGKLASSQATDPDVKNFAEQMVKDHGKANKELMEIAKAKGLETPKEPNKEQQGQLEKLKKASDKEFDRTYMDIMVKDHEKDVKEFKKASEKMDDQELKAWIVKTLPVLEKHLESAKQLHKTMQ